MLKILLIMISINFIACSKLPTKELYYIDQTNKICDVYEVDQKKIKIKFKENLEYTKCPIVYGYKQDDVAPVMQYIRQIKNQLEECQ